MNTLKRDPIIDAICNRVRQRFGDYYPALAGQPIDVRVVQVRRRQFATLCELLVSSGPPGLKKNEGQKTLLAKITLDTDQFDEPARQAPLRSYFVSAPDPPGVEVAALRSVHRHFHDLGQAQYFTVEVLDTLLDDRVLIVERVGARSLNQQLWSAARTGTSRRKRQQLTDAIHRAGRWLREFHNMPAAMLSAAHEGHERVVQREAFLQWIQAAGARMANCRQAARFFDGVQDRLVSTARAALPRQLPTAAMHGDYAPRNVLVDQQGRVAAIDILPEWTGCIWEDLAHFLMSVHTNKLQAFSCGAMFSAKVLAELDEALLSGYFQDDEIPWSAIRLYEAQVALTKWAAGLPVPQPGRPDVRGYRSRMRFALASRCYARYINNRLDCVEQSGVPSGPCTAVTPHASVDGERDPALTEALRQRASQYFPELAGNPVQVQRVSQQRRRFSLASVYRLSAGAEQREVFVKIPIASQALNSASDPGGLPDRPRLVPLLPADQEAGLEHEALGRMADHFACDANANLGVVRLLDRLSESAIVVEALHCPTLEQRVRQTNRQGWTLLRPAFRNAGRWLRKFHSMPPVESSRCRLAKTADVVAMLQSYSRYLGEWGVGADRLNRIETAVAAGLDREFQGTLPLVCGHGDFGLHNIFVTDEHRAIGFDTPALWRAPPEEDLAYFLLLLEAPPPWYGPRRMLQPNVVTTARDTFLEGYYGKPFSGGNALRWFEVFVALEKWVSCVHSFRRSHGLRRAAKRCRLFLQQRQLQTRIDRLISRPDHAATAHYPTSPDATSPDALHPEPPTETVDAR